jgi:type II secretory pathway component GspD/PulD (secretin)
VIAGIAFVVAQTFLLQAAGRRAQGAGMPALAPLRPVPCAQRPSDKTVNLDVKDEDVRVILRSMQKQCEIRNLVIDPKVQGNGTFVFHALPCRTAFETVTSTMSLKLETYENDVVVVAPR